MKIGIIEDNVEDAVFRYEKLAIPKHEVHLILDIRAAHKDPVLEVLMYRHGFDLHNLHYGLESLREKPFLTQLDMYFCNGLRGRYSELIDILGKERMRVHTSNGLIERDAQAHGLITLSEETLGEFIAQLNSH